MTYDFYTQNISTKELLKPVEDALRSKGYKRDSRWRGSYHKYFWTTARKAKRLYRIEVMASTAMWTIDIFKMMDAIRIVDSRLP